MVLILKNVPHDIVNVNLKNKPSWLFELHPEGKVPALDIGDRIITESLDIVEYLDEQYPDPPLRSGDGQLREKDNQVLQLFGKVRASSGAKEQATSIRDEKRNGKSFECNFPFMNSIPRSVENASSGEIVFQWKTFFFFVVFWDREGMKFFLVVG